MRGGDAGADAHSLDRRSIASNWKRPSGPMRPDRKDPSLAPAIGPDRRSKTVRRAPDFRPYRSHAAADYPNDASHTRKSPAFALCACFGASRPNRAIDGRGLSPHQARSLVGCSLSAGVSGRWWRQGRVPRPHPADSMFLPSFPPRGSMIRRQPSLHGVAWGDFPRFLGTMPAL
jgi:hypothetical protein